MKVHSPSRRLLIRSGFTLLEMVIVLGIIAMIMGGGIYGMKKIADKAKPQQAKQDITAMLSAISMYKINKNKYPSTQEGLRALVNGDYMDKLQKDPWDQEYIYRYPGKIDKSRPEIISVGEDGQEGTDDDINSQKF